VSNETGKLWIVATPIGNLDDFSSRGKATLEQAQTILCEDTRQGAKLISALGIRQSMSHLERLDAHTGEHVLRSWVRRMEDGEAIALITDAGTPAISDPGSTLVRMARERGIEVSPVPGPSAVPALLSVAGFEETSFTFRGFFPRSTADQKRELEMVRASSVSRIFVWFESPRRVRDALMALAEQCEGAWVAAAKELTKLHEKVFWGMASDVAAQVSLEIESEGELGEWVFAVKFPALQSNESATANPTERGARVVSDAAIKALHCLIDSRVPASEAARQVSHHFGEHKKSVYEAALKISGKKNDEGG
jgi:16S rRNA (cytidine1402-2'-O)-methyltransferase